MWLRIIFDCSGYGLYCKTHNITLKLMSQFIHLAAGGRYFKKSQPNCISFCEACYRGVAPPAASRNEDVDCFPPFSPDPLHLVRLGVYDMRSEEPKESLDPAFVPETVTDEEKIREGWMRLLNELDFFADLRA